MHRIFFLLMHRILRIICIHIHKQRRLEAEFMMTYNLIGRKENLSIDEDVNQVYKRLQISS